MNRVLKAVQRMGIPTGPGVGADGARPQDGTPAQHPDDAVRSTTDASTPWPAIPGADWAANARAAGSGTLSRGRRSRQVRIVELGPDAARPVLRAFAEKVPVGVGFAKRAGSWWTAAPDEFEELAGRLAVFRFDPRWVSLGCPDDRLLD